MGEWWNGFCWGVGASVLVDLAAVGLFIIVAMIGDRRTDRRSTERIRFPG